MPLQLSTQVSVLDDELKDISTHTFLRLAMIDLLRNFAGFELVNKFHSSSDCTNFDKARCN